MRRTHLPQTREFSIAPPLRSCLDWIATKCHIECCGVMALKPSPVLVEIWADSAGREKTAAALAEARSILALLSEATEPLSCSFLNYRDHSPDRTHFQQILRELIAALEACTQRG